MEVVQHTTPKGTAVNMAVGRSGTRTTIKPLGPKRYNSTKRSIVGWEDDNAGRLKVFENFKAHEGIALRAFRIGHNPNVKLRKALCSSSWVK